MTGNLTNHGHSTCATKLRLVQREGFLFVCACDCALTQPSSGAFLTAAGNYE
jgi:hypothetical protein